MARPGDRIQDTVGPPSRLVERPSWGVGCS